MADLRTDYKDDILDLTQNTQRKYRMITNDDGTVSFEDVTVYSQIGDSFGAADVNTITDALNHTEGSVKYNEEDDHNYYWANNQWVKGEKVNLFWDGYLYNNGTINGNYAGDILQNYASGANSGFVKNTNNITLSNSSGSQVNNAAFENKVDLTKVSKIILKGNIKVTNASSQSYAEIGISSEAIGSSKIADACEKHITSAKYTNTTYTAFTLEFDVSEVTGEKYVYVGLLTGSAVGGAYGWIEVKEVYVE